MASMLTRPACRVRLTRRSTPSRSGDDIDGNSPTAWTVVAPSSPSVAATGPVDRFVMAPVLELASRFITTIGRSAVTISRHRPVPSPSAPLRPSPSPVSSSSAVTMRDACAGSVRRTAEPGEAPSSSIPSTVTAAAASPGLLRRNRLTWPRVLAGLNREIRYPEPLDGTASCIPLTRPSCVRL